MVTKQDILKMLADSGLKKDGWATIHCSLRSVGEIEGGADGLIDAFKEYLSDGVFLVPTHTWGVCNIENPHYDVRSTVPNIGVLSQVAAFRRDAVRTLHPTHSLAVFAKNAKELARGEEKSKTPCPVGSLLSRLYENEGKIFLVGVGHERNTYLHAVDEMIDIENRLNPNKYTMEIIDYDGNSIKTEGYCGHYTEGLDYCCARHYPNYEKAFDYHNVVHYTSLGNARVRVCDVKKMTDLVIGMWKNTDRDLCFGEQEIPRQFYENIKF